MSPRDISRCYPRQYLDGKVNFFGYDFIVTPDVLIPRPETEILVEEAARIIRDAYHGDAAALDLGTGSGNIAISLTKEAAGSKISASDISENALSVARENARLNGVSGKICFFTSNLFSNIQDTFDIIVTNPPYVAVEEFHSLPEEVLAEPAIALDGGAGGVYFIESIIRLAPDFLKDGGHLLLEIGYDQSAAVRGLIESSGSLKLLKIKKDYAGIDRVVIAKKYG